ncbi:IS3 family transposase [uncultured Halomonas sp.]|uniref:IS3 family transposase n=1 Tax=uncultured Halomonas sp. TaxID=173971 RepID=UPI002624A280|nr:IS3 family transposase [uncultured Halomonas sp.]
MPRYSEERRQAVVTKLLPPHNLSPQVIAEQEGISLGTVYTWRKQARAEGRCLPDALGKGTDGWSSKDKFNAVLETASMNAQETAEYCRRRGIFPEQLGRWRHDCEQAASLSHSERQREADEAKQQRKRIKALEKELARKNEALAETAALLALRKKGEGDLGGRGRMISTPDRQRAIALIEEARAQGARLEAACRELGITARTYQRWTRGGELHEDQRPLVGRPVPANALTPAEEQEILDVCHRPEYASLPPEQIVVRLFDEEQRYLASSSSFYRVMRKHHEMVHRGRAKPPQRRAKPTTYQATAPNQVWSWDCTWLGGPIKGQHYYLVMMVDIFSRKITSWEVFLAESAYNSRTVLERAVLAERIIDQPLVLHADNGSPFKGATLLEKLHELGITPSFSRPRVSNDNPYSEALFRTCKCRPCYPTDGFATLDNAREWVAGFVQWYNHEHRHSGIRLVTPAQRHAGEDKEVLAKRHVINQAARDANPARWSGKTRNWTPIGTVSLNPERELQVTVAEPEKQVA